MQNWLIMKLYSLFIVLFQLLTLTIQPLLLTTQQNNCNQHSLINYHRLINCHWLINYHWLINLSFGSKHIAWKNLSSGPSFSTKLQNHRNFCLKLSKFPKFKKMDELVLIGWLLIGLHVMVIGLYVMVIGFWSMGHFLLAKCEYKQIQEIIFYTTNYYLIK